jgi:pimeloyl-ACP methyl ester carboxylesterase
MTTLVLLVIVILVCVFCAGLIAEASRIAPKTPEQLYWALPIRYLEIDGNRIRYIRTGSGPNLVLLHTLRTQLDIFERLVPLVEKSFTVYAHDYPGRGSPTFRRPITAPSCSSTVEGFLNELDLSNVTFAGISIGGVIPLIIAAKMNKRVTEVIAINPYDYGRGTGLARANAMAGLIFTLARVPVLGEMIMRLRNVALENRILRGGVADPNALTPGFYALTYASGLRPGHYHAFLNLIRQAHHWDEARQRYGKIDVPVLVVYSEQDWSHAEERNARSSRFLERGSRWCLTADIFCRSTSPSDSPRSSSASRDRPQAEQLPPPSTQNLAQCGWQSLTAPEANMPPSARAASARVAPISKAGS